jgi:diguanylate cyclase (GGDEF)-like protein
MYVLVSLATQPSAGRGSALEALVDAAAGILAADSLDGTLGRISHHLRSLLRYDDLTVYEIDDTQAFLRPVFAVGDWVEEILSDRIPLGTGITGWAVRNRRTKNVPNSNLEPLCNVVAGTPEDAEAFVCVPLLAEERVVGALNVYRTGADMAFTDEEVQLVERFATMAALAYDSARQRETLREQVKRDGLTGLLNHRACQEHLRAALETALPEGRPVGVVVLDIDHFKLINDAHGHAEGDRVLAAVAQTMRQHLRAEDQIGRLGGEEFLVLLPETDARAAHKAAEKMRANVAAGGVTISVGWAAWAGEEADELLRRADDALYAAKAHGRNCVKGAPATLPRRR